MESRGIRDTTQRRAINFNLGIGTTGPGSKLDVAGNLRAQGWTTIGTGNDKLNLELQGTFHRMAFNELRFWDWQTGEMVTFNNGNVGIGTASPSQKLDVGSGNVSANDYWIQKTGKWASQMGALLVWVYTNALKNTLVMMGKP